MTPEQTVDAWVAAHRQDLSDSCATLFDYAEPAWREYRSAAWYVDRLQREGFTVEAGSAGMPTAFVADWSNGAGPAVGMYAEYDAVPGNCQAPRPQPGPRDGQSPFAAGHTDPHSALGIGSLAGLLATKAAMEAHGIPGRLRFTGEPAEKVRGSKPIHAAAGMYDGVDAILSFHPFYMLPLCNTVRWETHCGAAYAMIYRFQCDAAHTWGAQDGAPIPQSHSDIRAPGANDALVMMYQQARVQRASMLPNSGGWSMSEAILSAGQATADNLPATLADLQYLIRVPDLKMAEQITGFLDRLAQTCAQATGCRVTRHWVSKSRPGLPNLALARAGWSALQAVGAPQWDARARTILQEAQVACGQPAEEDPLLPACTELMDPEMAEEILRRDLPPSQANSTSDDYTEMCWHAPTLRLYLARPALKGGPWPAWVMNALGGIPETIDPMVRCAGRVLGRVALRVLTDPALRDEMRTEFLQRRGDAPLPPLCDYPPPLDFAWPEYIETPRGRSWHIPG